METIPSERKEETDDRINYPKRRKQVVPKL
jgi:hypothetical protein